MLVAGGVAVDRVKLRKPESTLGGGTPEEGRRVEIRVVPLTNATPAGS